MTASLHKLAAGRDAGLYYVNDPNREARPIRRDEYYVGEGGGVWWTTAETLVRNGAPIEKETFRDLCAGIHPATGASLVRAAGANHRAGWDITFSAPKSVSILWMAGDAQQRTILQDSHRAAVRYALGLLEQERLVEVRSGVGGRIREKPSVLIVGLFDHFTSREGDPNIHTHSVLMNVAGRSGSATKFLTIDPDRLYEWQLVLGAAYRADLSARLAVEGFQFREAGRNQFEVAGIPEAVLEMFSKRTQQIEGRVARSASAAQKELAALATRGAKDEVPTGEVLERRWQEELTTTGISPWQAARSHTPDLTRELSIEPGIDPPAVIGTGPIAVAASELFQHQNVISRKDLILSAFVKASLTGIAPDSVRQEIDSSERAGVLLALSKRHADYCWTTAAIAETEARLLRQADRADENDWFSTEAVEAALTEAPHLSDEQQKAIRHATSRDGVSICEAGAGTGKTTLTRALVDAARRSRLTVLGVAPTWVAADELSKACGIEALAIAKWRHDLMSGKRPKFDSMALIIVDEVGVAGLRELEAVLTAARPYGKVICLGDRKQLQSVSGGSALRAVSDVVGRSAVLNQVRRQEVSWQCAASVVMAKGDSGAGLRAYVQNDRVQFTRGETNAQATTIRKWTEYRRLYGAEVLMITRRNSDSAALNNAARVALREEGRLTGPDHSFDALDREKKKVKFRLAQGDYIRFGENLPELSIRNGTRGTIESINLQGTSPSILVRLDDGRRVQEEWSNLARIRLGGDRLPPRITHAYAGTAYSVQGRTSSAAVLYIARATDAREIYVGLTRHKFDASVIVERDRLEAAVRQRHPERREVSDAILGERLFDEAQLYAEKANVVDYVNDRIDFIRTGIVELNKVASAVDVRRIVHAAQRLMNVRLGIVPGYHFLRRVWPLSRGTQRITSDRIADILHSISTRIRDRAKERLQSIGWTR